MNKLIKFRHANNKGIFHYTVLGGHFVALSETNTSKIDYIKEHGTLDLTFDHDGEKYDLMAVDVIEDKEYVEKVYNHFLTTKNAYFKEGFEHLCVLRFHK